MKNPIYINDVGGISLAHDDDSGTVYADPGSALHARAESGEFGSVAPYVAPTEQAPTDYAPQSITRRQGRLELLSLGKLDAVEAAIAGIADPAERRAAEIEYETNTWELGNQFLRDMWVRLGGKPDDLAEMFVSAEKR